MTNEQPQSLAVVTPQTGSSYIPTRKVGASALAGALSIIVVWVINSFILTDPNGTQITGEIASALTTILTFLAGYFVPEPL